MEMINLVDVLNDDRLYDISDFFKVLGDSSRLKILLALNNNEMTVSDLANKVNMSISAVSHQLKILKTNKIVKHKKVGKNIYYLHDDEHITDIIKLTCEHLSER